MKALHKDFWMEVKKSKARFISIFFIVALGVAFFSGIQAASPDMRFSGDAYYDSARLMDLKVVGTMGLTDEDVQAVREVAGVQEAEGAYFTDVICGEEENQKVLHIESLNENVNEVTATEGRLPEKSGEILLDSAFAAAQGYKVSDTINLSQEDSELLEKEVYTVVGLGSSPLYISFNRGNTTLGSGEVNGFAYVLAEDFDNEVYTQIYIRVHGAKGLTSYTDAYDNLIEKIQERVEGIEKERCQARYDSVVSDAQKELDDAGKELADAKKEAEKELADGKKKITDAEKELKDGKEELEDGKKQLEDGKQELIDGRAQMEDGRRQLADGWSQINSAKSQLADGQSQLAAAKEELAAGWAELNKNQAELDAGYAELNKGQAELDAAKAKLQEGRDTLAQKQAELDAAIARTESGQQQIDAARSQLAATRQQCSDGLVQVEAGEAQLPAQEEQLNQLLQALQAANDSLSQAQAEYAAALEDENYLPEELSALEQRVNELSTQAGEYQAQADAAQAGLDAERNELAAKRAELEGGIAQVEAGLLELDGKEQELQAAKSQFPAAQAELDQGLKELTEQEANLKPAAKELKKNRKKLDSGQAELNAAKAQLDSGQAELDANEGSLAAAQGEIDANIHRLNSSQAEIDANEARLADAENEIAENEKKLADAEKELEDGEKELADAKEEYGKAEKDANKEIADAEKEIADAQKEIDDLKMPEWIVTDRNNLPEYSDYGDNADRIRNIGQVFPVIFFLVAALISLTTMTRMVEEQRTQIGTMKALGYSKYAIASKYLNYAFLATVGGSVLGVLIGEKFLPWVIIKAYGIMYHNMDNSMQLHYEFKFAMIASVAAVICTIGATVFSCCRALLESPASLMRPPAPKEGKRVLIERVTVLWKHLNFTWKSTLRNLFRYKKRFFMTIFGIAGSMALMLVGFGLQDSIMDIAVLQYRELQHYDGTIIADEDATETQKQELEEFLEKNETLSRYTNIQLTKMTAPKGKSNISVYVYIPENLETFREDVTLRDRETKEIYELTEEGAVISEKTASLLGIRAGEMLTLELDNKEYEVKVANITENYMGHYVYMTPGIYEETFREKPDFASIEFTMKEEYKQDMEQTGNDILKNPAALSISYTSSLEGQMERMLSSLETVIIVLIVSAGMLAFVVLYNLNNINITERQRELATLKVLGFYDREVSQYVFRENILLTLIGVGAGAILGIFLHRFVIITVEVDAVMFGRNIKPMSFLYSALFTCGFSAFVNMVMHFKLKKIDMVESLKSVE